MRPDRLTLISFVVGAVLVACAPAAPAGSPTPSSGVLTAHGTVLDAAVNECRYDGADWGRLVVTVA